MNYRVNDRPVGRYVQAPRSLPFDRERAEAWRRRRTEALLWAVGIVVGLAVAWVFG